MNKLLVRDKADEVRGLLADNYKTLPINVFDICCGLDINISKHPINSEAYLICESGNAEIILKIGISETRERFSIAHELGHYFLPGHENLMFRCTEQDMNYDETRPYETEANVFASELLIPTDLLRNDITQDISYKFISEQANKYHVSIQAMVIKLLLVTDESIAALWVQDSVIKWAVRSQSFEHLITRGKISHLSNAYEFFRHNDKKIRTNVVDASAWIDNSDIDTLIEDCTFFPRFNNALVLLRYE